MKKATVLYDKNFTVGKVDKRLYGSFVEHLGRCLYKGVYEPDHTTADKHGFREDVKELIRELGVTAIRYPGGNFVSGYDWKDGVGPKENRPRKKDMAWNTIETNEVGTNEFAAYMKDLDIELLMTANLGTGTPKDAGELVDYCNTREGTFFSDLRISHGVREPHNIKTWYLGNEMDGEWQIMMHTAEEYARICKEAGKIVKWMDPDTETIACGSCTNEINHVSFGDWDRVVLEEAYDYIDYISLHRYFNYNPQKQLAYKMYDNVTDIPFFFKDLQVFLDTVIHACDFVKGKRRAEKTIHISFDEWGVITDTGAVPGGVEQEYGFASFKQLDAVIYGGILCTFLNNADRVKIACQSLLVNEGGMITTDPAGRTIRQSTYYPFRDVAHYGKGVSLKGITNLPGKMTDHHGEQETVVVSATYDDETGEIAIFAVNCDLEEEAELAIDLRSFGKLEGIACQEFYHKDPYAKNTFEDEFCVIPKEKPLPDITDGRIAMVLKEHSWNMLRIKAEK